MRIRSPRRAMPQTNKLDVHIKANWDTRNKIGLAQNGRPWCGRPEVTLASLRRLTRCQDVLDTSVRQLRKDYPTLSHSDLIKDAWCQVTCSVGRLPKSNGNIKRLQRNSVMYSYEKDLVLSGLSHLQMIGWHPHSAPDSVATDAELRDLSGSSFSIPISALVMSALISNPWGPWWALLADS